MLLRWESLKPPMSQMGLGWVGQQPAGAPAYRGKALGAIPGGPARQTAQAAAARAARGPRRAPGRATGHPGTQKGALNRHFLRVPQAPGASSNKEGCPAYAHA
jgi:hypothetical protein